MMLIHLIIALIFIPILINRSFDLSALHAVVPSQNRVFALFIHFETLQEKCKYEFNKHALFVSFFKSSSSGFETTSLLFCLSWLLHQLVVYLIRALQLRRDLFGCVVVSSCTALVDLDFFSVNQASISIIVTLFILVTKSYGNIYRTRQPFKINNICAMCTVKIQQRNSIPTIEISTLTDSTCDSVSNENRVM